MITLQRFKTGLARYADTELVPKLEGWEKIAFGAGASLMLSAPDEKLLKLLHSPAISMMGIVDEQDNIDIDALYKAVVPQFESKQRLPLPLVGDFTFDRSDIETLYRFMTD